MQIVKFSDINNCVENKNNKFLNIDGLNTKDIEIEVDMDLSEVRFNLVFIIGACVSKDYKILDLINKEKLTQRNIEQLKALKEFLISCNDGVMEFESIRKDLLQFEIVTNSVNYQVEIHLGNHNFCVCDDFNVVSIDAYK